MSGLWEEVKTRKIFKAATIYAAVAWGIIQIADVLLPVLNVEDWVMSSMVLVAFSGFPLALIVGWMLDLKLERQRLNASNDEEVTRSSLGARIGEFAVISAFGIGAAYLYYNSSSEPVHAGVADQISVQQLLPAEKEQKTIAVLPFANFSDSSDDEFFADGLSEELLNVLARNKRLRVAARTSSFQYKNTNINVKTIARELGVQYILEGSVRRSGDLIRVTAQLIKADEDVHVFSRSWDRNVSNVFKVQDEIAQSVLDELKVNLFGESESVISEIGTKSIEAFAEYSRGNTFLRNRGKQDFEDAIAAFEKALAIDANYTEAKVMIAKTHLLKMSYGLLDYEQAQQKSAPLIDSALADNPLLAEAHAVKGLLHWQQAGRENNEQQLANAKQHFIHALELNPSQAETYMWYGSILLQQGHFNDGVLLHKKAFEIDPRSPIVGYNRAQDLVRLGRYEEAMNVFNQVVRNNPNYANAYSIAGDVSYAVGQLDQAFRMYNRAATLGDDETMWLVNSSRILIPMGMYARAQKNVDQLKERLNKKYLQKFDWLQAFVWLSSGNIEAFNQWTQAFEEDTQVSDQRLWRGVSYLNSGQWQYAIDDLQAALKLSRLENSTRIDESTIRIQLFLATAYRAMGNKLESGRFLDQVESEFSSLKQQGVTSQILRYQQGVVAALKGQKQQALSILKRAVQEGFVDFWFAELDPAFKTLRSEPEFAVIRDDFKMRISLMKANLESEFAESNERVL